MVASILGIKIVGFDEKYIGLPIPEGHMEEEILSAQWKPGYHGPAYQGPLYLRKNFTKDQALQAWRDSRAWRGLAKGSLAKGSRQGLGEATPSLAKAFLSRDCSAHLTGRTWALNPL